MFERLRRVAGNGPEPPCAFACLGVIGGEVATHRLFGSARSDNHFAFHDTDSRSKGVVFARRVLNRPHDLPSALIERDNTAVGDAGKHLAVIDRDTAVARATADLEEV